MELADYIGQLVIEVGEITMVKIHEGLKIN